MNRINKIFLGLLISSLPIGPAVAQEVTAAKEIDPTWESLAANYQVPQWFVDGKIGVWFHWGISSAADENRPNDGSHYGRRMYSPPPEDKADKDCLLYTSPSPRDRG